jgi:hypothetical protein
MPNSQSQTLGSFIADAGREMDVLSFGCQSGFGCEVGSWHHGRQPFTSALVSMFSLGGEISRTRRWHGWRRSPSSLAFMGKATSIGFFAFAPYPASGLRKPSQSLGSLAAASSPGLASLSLFAIPKPFETVPPVMANILQPAGSQTVQSPWICMARHAKIPLKAFFKVDPRRMGELFPHGMS